MMLHERDAARWKARTSKSPCGWQCFRPLYNRCFTVIRSVRSSVYVTALSDSEGNPATCWRPVKSLSNYTNSSFMKEKEIQYVMPSMHVSFHLSRCFKMLDVRLQPQCSLLQWQHLLRIHYHWSLSRNIKVISKWWMLCVHFILKGQLGLINSSQVFCY